MIHFICSGQHFEFPVSNIEEALNGLFGNLNITSLWDGFGYWVRFWEPEYDWEGNKTCDGHWVRVERKW